MTGRQSIADIFAEFYEALYTSPNQLEATDNIYHGTIPDVNMSELDQTFKNMKSNKARDTSGVVVEMLKHSNSGFRETLLWLFNQMLQTDSEPPAVWKNTCIKVLYKKGDSMLPAN